MDNFFLCLLLYNSNLYLSLSWMAASSSGNRKKLRHRVAPNKSPECKMLPYLWGILFLGYQSSPNSWRSPFTRKGIKTIRRSNPSGRPGRISEAGKGVTAPKVTDPECRLILHEGRKGHTGYLITVMCFGLSSPILQTGIHQWGKGGFSSRCTRFLSDHVCFHSM